MKITRRFFITASAGWGMILAVSGLFRVFNIRSSYASNRILTNAKEQKKFKITPRVVSVHSGKAVRPDHVSYPYVDSIDPLIVEKMMDRGLIELTQERTAAHAWRCLFGSYKEGEVIAIKPNFNDLHKEFRDNIVVSPAVLNAVIKGLTENLKVRAENVVVYDCSRTIPDPYRKRINYPVKFVEPYGSSLMRKIQYKTFGNPMPEADREHEIIMTHDVRNKRGDRVQCYLPGVIASADHIINVPVLKSHQFVLASGALKNHYGTVRFSDGHLSPEYLHPPIIHESVADINAHPEIRGKTRLIVMDAIFGRLNKKGGPPDKWSTFNDGNPNRLFLSNDPVALDSVSAFFVKNELKARNDTSLSDEYLRVAADRNIGIYEMPVREEDFKSIDFMCCDI